MTFSLVVPLIRSRTVGGYRKLFKLFVLTGMIFPVVLIGTIELFLALVMFVAFGRAFTAEMRGEVRADRIERQNMIGVTFENRGARHSRHHAGVFALGDGDAAGSFDCAETLS